MAATINILDKSKADELAMLGFKYTSQRVSDEKQVYVFFNTPELVKIISEKFSVKDYYFGKTMNF